VRGEVALAPVTRQRASGHKKPRRLDVGCCEVCPVKRSIGKGTSEWTEVSNLEVGRGRSSWLVA
jgi:hypothetical protein